ncbi:hypothetical protein MCERE85_01367 [Candidatus Nanopelagicaceae bacterium]
MKRALLIAGGTVGGLGAVLAITPPQLTSSGSINIAGGSAIGSSGTSSSASASSSSSTKAVATASATKTAKPVATKKATPAASATAAATKSATPTAAATTAAATPASKSGTFTGPSVFVNYGTVQVKITVQNGKIVDAVAVQAPSGRNDRYTNMAVPILKQQTLAAQSANIKGASGASYTSYGWFKSLQGALADAGL